MLQLAEVSKEYKMLVKNEIPKRKFQAFSDIKKKFTTRQILKRNFYNASDFDLKSYDASDFKVKYIFKKYNSEEKLSFEKQISKEKSHTKSHVLTYFNP